MSGRVSEPPVLADEARILVVEDDGEMRGLLTRLLREHGFQVTGVRDGRAMWEAFEHATFDLVLLDVMLPGASGLDLCRALRERSIVPIIILTARGSETDRVLGLELGSDDYIAKPFSRPELLARIRAALRRARLGRDELPGHNSQRVVFAGWTLDFARRELTDPRGAITDLSTAEYDLLLAFVEHPQRVLSRDQLLDLSRRRDGDVYDRSVDVLVSRLRRKLETDDASTALIKTVRNVGYMFIPAPQRTAL
ncbi:MAG: DNA-binding response regulator [Rhodospirillales bacterium 69-11]|nr:MAG: DNA-binding response regulator [Rhodospirillales bacterium 69-11]